VATSTPRALRRPHDRDWLGWCRRVGWSTQMKVLIIGAGPAAAGAALALSGDPDVDIRVIDVGGRLEADNDAARLRMAAAAPTEWSSSDVRIVSESAHRTEGNPLPEKRNFGSDFPFHDFGQLEGVSGEGGVNTHVVSGAYGGFTNTWGAQTMVYSAASFDDWPSPDPSWRPTIAPSSRRFPTPANRTIWPSTTRSGRRRTSSIAQRECGEDP